MRRDDERLTDIVDAAEAIGRYLAGRSFADLLHDEILQDAVLRRLTIIGEAANHLTTTFKLNHPEVSWSGAASFRHFVVHEYFRIDWEIVWETVTIHLPVLATQAKKIVEEKGHDER